MILYNIYDLFINHKNGDWIPDLNNCEDMHPSNPHMLDNQEALNKYYLKDVSNDNTLTNFERFCATKLMSIDMAEWCKKHHLYEYKRENYYKTVNFNGDKYVWDPAKNSDGSEKSYIDKLNFKYEYHEYSAIDNTLTLSYIAGYLYDEDFTKYYRSGTQDFICLSILSFFRIILPKFGIHVRISPFNTKAVIAYCLDDEGKATLIRSSNNTVEFFEEDYMTLIIKLFNTCKKIQESL